jgi:hypothetical protein
MERENLAGDAKGKGVSGSNRALNCRPGRRLSRQPSGKAAALRVGLARQPGADSTNAVQLGRSTTEAGIARESWARNLLFSLMPFGPKVAWLTGKLIV